MNTSNYEKILDEMKNTEPTVQDLQNSIGWLGYKNHEGFKEIAMNIAQVDEHIRTMSRKERKKLVHRGMAMMRNGHFVVLEVFDDGSQVAKECIFDVHGPWEVSLLKSKRQKNPENFFIKFANGNVVIGERKKLKPSYLYELFVKSGIAFNYLYSVTDVGKMLFEFFAPEIETTENVLIITDLPGWSTGRYFTKATFPFSKVKLFNSLPVNESYFYDGEITTIIIREYEKKLQAIEEDSERLVLTLFVYASVLSTLLVDASIPINKMLNIVVGDRTIMEEVESYFRVFKKTGSWIVDGSMKSKAFFDAYKNSKDEVFLVDFRNQKNSDSNVRKKLLYNQRTITDIVSGIRSFSEEIPAVGVVMISESLVVESHVVNLFWNNRMLNSTQEVKHDLNVVPVVLKNFICYIENNMDSIQRIFDKYRFANVKSDIAAFKAVCEIVNMFWNNYDVDFLEILHLSKSITIEEAFTNNFVDYDDLEELLISNFRENAKTLFFEKKNQKEHDKDSVIHNSDYIWVPSNVFNRFAEHHGLKKYLPQVLIALKEKGKLVTDSSGFTRKLQVAGKRSEYYQFRREFFNVMGLPDVVDLGKGV